MNSFIEVYDSTTDLPLYCCKEDFGLLFKRDANFQEFYCKNDLTIVVYFLNGVWLTLM